MATPNPEDLLIINKDLNGDQSAWETMYVRYGDAIGPVKGDEGPQGPVGPSGPRGETGLQGVIGPEGKRGLRGNPGENGKSVVGPRGAPGAPGAPGEKGNDGLGLTLKSFKRNQNYHRGDYVFASSTKNDGHNSMYIALDSFTATLTPSEDTTHWKEFAAPKGEKGDRGPKGLRGPIGETGVGQPGPTGPRGPIGLRGPTGTVSESDTTYDNKLDLHVLTTP